MEHQAEDLTYPIALGPRDSSAFPQTQTNPKPSYEMQPAPDRLKFHLGKKGILQFCRGTVRIYQRANTKSTGQR